jgi:hypothetical protein
MKHLKTFESYKREDISEEIAKDILPKFQKMRSDGQEVTIDDFDRYMKERGADSDTIDSVMHYLINIGFDFDINNEDEEDDIDFELKNRI